MREDGLNTQYRHTSCVTHPQQRTHWHANLPVLRPLEDMILNEVAACQKIATGELELVIDDTSELRALREQDRVKRELHPERRRKQARLLKGDNS
jgi:hypothetical protein